jgi:hypothetical protein
MRTLLALLAAALAAASPLGAAPPGRTLAGLAEVPLDQLSHREVGNLGRAALALRPKEWKHAESENFILHFFSKPQASAVAQEAEYFYRFLTSELAWTGGLGGPKPHIFVFDQDADWASFQVRGVLEPWTGGIMAEGNLFLPRSPGARWDNRTIGHEMTHLLLRRWIGSKLPLALEEGYAEFVAIRGYSAYYRARGYDAKPFSDAVPPGAYTPLPQFIATRAYPPHDRIEAFYAQGDRLVRFLHKAGKPQLLDLLKACATGTPFPAALARAFPSRFPTVDALEKEFRPYASRDFGSSLGDN